MRLSRDQGLMICDYCGGETTPPTDEDGVVVLEPTKHNCPVCGTPLANACIESHDLLYCTSCHGMLLEMEAFVPLLERSARVPLLVHKLASAAQVGRKPRLPLPAMPAGYGQASLWRRR